MRTTTACLFGGTLFAAGLSAPATAQCDTTIADTIAVNPLSSPYSSETYAFTISNGKLYMESYDATYVGSNYVVLNHFQVWDLSDPQDVSRIALGASTADNSFQSVRNAFAVFGDTLVGVRDFDLVVVDISDPNNPTDIGTVDAPGFIRSALNVDGVLVSHSGVPNVLRVFDMTNPQSPQLRSSINVGQLLNLGQPVGTRIPFRDGSNVGIIDVSDPANPSRVTTPGGGNDPVLVGNTVVTAAGSVLQVFDFSDPDNPVRLPDFPNPSDVAVNLATTGAHVYAAGGNTLHVIKFTDPAQPVVVDTATAPGTIDNLAVGDGVIVARHQNSEEDGGFAIFDVSTCSVLPALLLSPPSRLVDPGSPPETFSVIADLATGYQWLRDGQPLAEGGDFAGVRTPDLTVTPSDSTEGVYTCIAINSNGSVASVPAVLGVRADPNPCAADLTGEGILDLTDIDAFITSFVAGCP